MDARSRAIWFPLSQVLSAAAALSGWLALSVTAPSSDQVVPIGSYTFGVPGGLVASLGIAYVVPNYFRDHGAADRRGTGPWSTPARVAVASCLAVDGAGLLALVASEGRTPWLTTAAACAVAALLALGVLLAQIGRASDRIGLTVAGLATSPGVAAIWLGAVVALDGRTAATVAAVLAMVVGSGLVVACLRPYLGRTGGTPGVVGHVLRAALPMVPHLVCFGILVQGVRVVAIFGDDAELTTDAHQVMLVISVGLTLLASVNSYLGPRLQSAARPDYPRLRAAATRAFVVAGPATGLVVLAGLWGTSVLGLVSLDARGVTFVAAAYVAAAFAAYYSLSAQFVRELMTVPLAAASALALAALLAIAAALPLRDLDQMLGAYAAAVTVLVAVLLALAVATSRRQRDRYALGGLVPLVPFGVALLAGVVAS